MVVTRVELRSLVDLSEFYYYNITIDTVYFPDAIDAGEVYWSSSPYAYSGSASWGVAFNSGISGVYHRSSAYAARLVRGGK